MTKPTFSWYLETSGPELEQGDLIEGCPVFLPPEALADDLTSTAAFRWEERDLILMSQSCDLVTGREKLTDVLFCAVWQRSELTEGYLATRMGLEEARRGNLPGFHVLAASDLPGLQREVRVVDFRRIYSLPLPFVRKRAAAVGKRIRLLPPYREHLSQAFARFFMRVGLPVDIPAFK